MTLYEVFYFNRQNNSDYAEVIPVKYFTTENEAINLIKSNPNKNYHYQKFEYPSNEVE